MPKRYLSTQEHRGRQPQHSLGSPQQRWPVLCRHLRLPRLGVGGEGGGGVQDCFWKKLRGKNSKRLPDGQRNTLRGGCQMHKYSGVKVQMHIRTLTPDEYILVWKFWWSQRDDGHKTGNWKCSSKWNRFSCELAAPPLNWVKQGHFYAQTHGDGLDLASDQEIKGLAEVGFYKLHSQIWSSQHCLASYFVFCLVLNCHWWMLVNSHVIMRQRNFVQQHQYTGAMVRYKPYNKGSPVKVCFSGGPIHSMQPRDGGAGGKNYNENKSIVFLSDCVKYKNNNHHHCQLLMKLHSG